MVVVGARANHVDENRPISSFLEGKADEEHVSPIFRVTPVFEPRRLWSKVRLVSKKVTHEGLNPKKKEPETNPVFTSIAGGEALEIARSLLSSLKKCCAEVEGT